MEISIAISDDNSSPCVFKHTLTALSKPCDVIELKNQVKNIQVKCNEYLTTLVEKEKVEGNGSNIITSTASNDDGKFLLSSYRLCKQVLKLHR